MTYGYDDDPYDEDPWPPHRYGPPYIPAARIDRPYRRCIRDHVSMEEERLLPSIDRMISRHRRSPVFVWGPELVRAVLSGAQPEHDRHSLEDRTLIVDLVRRLVHLSHADVELEPQWTAQTLAAVEDCRREFLAGARTARRIAHDRRVAQVARLRAGSEDGEIPTGPLPAEALDLDGVLDEIVPRLRGIDDLMTERFARLPVTAETRTELVTVGRRLLRRLALADPQRYVRPSLDIRIAGGLVVVAAEANGIPRDEVRTAFTHREYTSVSERGRSLLDGTPVALVRAPLPTPEDVAAAWADRTVLNDPRLQTDTTRRLVAETIAAVENEYDEATDPALTGEHSAPAVHATPPGVSRPQLRVT